MCGIAGVTGHHQNKNLIDNMINIMNHRGPDFCGFFYSEHIHLGHCRLSINDLSQNAAQPFIDKEKSVAVCVNGEIYNFSEIRKDLVNKGYQFKSQSDSEVVIHGYIEFGLAIFEKLNGMFAIAIWDDKKKELILGRDRLGIKPLYYSCLPEQKSLTFASELKAISQNTAIDMQTDMQSFAEYLLYENYFSNRTLNKTIKMVEPGEIVIYATKINSVRRKKFWMPSFTQRQFVSDTEQYEKYRDILDRSVSRHLLSDVPLGFYLSSGFDSSSVVCCAATQLKNKIETYTGYFGMKGFYDESEDAKKIADSFGTNHTKVRIDPADFERDIEKIIWHLDEPRVGMGSFSQYMVAKKASEDVKVILTGHGGDEFFAGYPVFKVIYGKRNIFSLIKKSSLRESMHAAYFLFSPLVKKENSFFLPNIFSLRSLKSVLTKHWYNEIVTKTDPLKELNHLKNDCENDYERLVLTYLKYYLPALFNIEDKISMAFSLESRTPLCDNEMLDFALSIPLSKKLQNLDLKHIPKTAMKNRLPGFLYKLPKRGFPTPLSYWFKDGLKDFVKEYILDNHEYIEMFNRSEVEKMISRVQNSKFNTPLNEIPAHRVWILLNLVVYFRNQKFRYKYNGS